MEQKEYLADVLRPIKNKILGVVPGNHEYRMMREVGVNPLYDVCCRLGIEDVYRENACFIKVGIGTSKKNPDRQVQYALALVHGASQNKHDAFSNGIDGVDVIFSGHDHKPRHVPRGKIRFNINSSTVSIVPYQEVIVKSFPEYGGYALRGEYLPTCTSGTQVVRLYSGTRRVDYEFSQT
jgi:predicted phosphodiesterase